MLRAHCDICNCVQKQLYRISAVDYTFLLSDDARRLADVCAECLADGLRPIKSSSGNYEMDGPNLERVGK